MPEKQFGLLLREWVRPVKSTLKSVWKRATSFKPADWPLLRRRFSDTLPAMMDPEALHEQTLIENDMPALVASLLWKHRFLWRVQARQDERETNGCPGPSRLLRFRYELDFMHDEAHRLLPDNVAVDEWFRRVEERIDDRRIHFELEWVMSTMYGVEYPYFATEQPKMAKKWSKVRASKTGFPFLKLPAELRNMIYDQMLRPQGFVRIDHRGRAHHKSAITAGILATSKQINHEAWQILWQTPLLFDCYIYEIWAFLSARPQSALDQIRHISLSPLGHDGEAGNTEMNGLDATHRLCEFITSRLTLHSLTMIVRPDNKCIADRHPNPTAVFGRFADRDVHCSIRNELLHLLSDGHVKSLRFLYPPMIVPRTRAPDLSYKDKGIKAHELDLIMAMKREWDGDGIGSRIDMSLYTGPPVQFPALRRAQYDRLEFIRGYVQTVRFQDRFEVGYDGNMEGERGDAVVVRVRKDRVGGRGGGVC